MFCEYMCTLICLDFKEKKNVIQDRNFENHDFTSMSESDDKVVRIYFPNKTE